MKDEALDADGPAKRAMQTELSRVVIDNGAEVFAACGVEGLNRLQGFDRETLQIADALQIAIE